MKITLNVDGALLKRVMAGLGTGNKTQAIDLALREMDRQQKLRRYAGEGMGLSAEELAQVFDPDYDLAAARVSEGAAAYKGKRD